MENWDSILNYIKNEASPEEKEVIDQWLRQSEANREQFEQIKNIWEQSATLAPPISPDKSKAWQSIQQKIKEETKTEGAPVSKNRSTGFWPLAMAAGLVLAVFAIFLFRSGINQSAVLTVKTGDTTKTVDLPDGTRVFLNKNSLLTYPEVFASHTREVSLTGEAFFEVKRNPEQPFRVENKNFEITVLGTSFNVSAYEKDPAATVHVVTGKVALLASSGASVVLEKQEAGVLNVGTGQLLKQKSTDLNFLSWKSKKLEFKDAGFNEVCERLKDYFSITVEVKEQAIYKCRFTGMFEDPTLAQVISILEKTLGIKAAVADKRVVFTGKGC